MKYVHVTQAILPIGFFNKWGTFGVLLGDYANIFLKYNIFIGDFFCGNVPNATYS